MHQSRPFKEIFPLLLSHSWILKNSIIYSLAIFFSSLFLLLPCLPSSLPPSFLPCIFSSWVGKNKIQQNYLPHENPHKCRRSKLPSSNLENALQGFQTARFCVCVYVCRSILDSFNVSGSPLPNQIGVRSHRKVHRGLSLMHYNR